MTIFVQAKGELNLRQRRTDKGEALLDVLANRHLEEMLRQEPALTSSLRRLKKMGS